MKKADVPGGSIPPISVLKERGLWKVETPAPNNHSF